MFLLPIRRLFLVLAWGRCEDGCFEASVQVSNQALAVVMTQNWYEIQIYITGAGQRKPDIVFTNFWQWAHRAKQVPAQQQP